MGLMYQIKIVKIEGERCSEIKESLKLAPANQNLTLVCNS